MGRDTERLGCKPADVKTGVNVEHFDGTVLALGRVASSVPPLGVLYDEADFKQWACRRVVITKVNYYFLALSQR
jgi:hypothetical protein